MRGYRAAASKCRGETGGTVEGVGDVSAHRVTLRVYAVDRSDIVTWERPEIRVTTAEPPDVLGSSLNWPLCACERATGTPCPAGRA